MSLNRVSASRTHHQHPIQSGDSPPHRNSGVIDFVLDPKKSDLEASLWTFGLTVTAPLWAPFALLTKCGHAQGSETDRSGPSVNDAGDRMVDGAVMMRDAGSSADTSDSRTVAEQVADALCEQINTCFPDTLMPSRCVEILSDPSIDIYSTQVQLYDEFGVPLGDRDGLTWNEVIAGEKNGDFTADPTVAAQCLADIEQTSCSELSFAYDPTNPENLANLENSIPDSCGTLYRASEAP